ncbi:Molecular chaperone Hsp31 and glyoxalase 3 [compost metagenome]
MKKVLEWAAAKDKFVISLCHGPAALLAAGMGESRESYIFNGYKICAFPDDLDTKTPDIGYMPGHLTWKFGEKLKALGFEIINQDISGAVHKDRKLLTGDSPLAGNALGKLAAVELLKETAGK